MHRGSVKQISLPVHSSPVGQCFSTEHSTVSQESAQNLIFLGSSRDTGGSVIGEWEGSRVTGAEVVGDRDGTGSVGLTVGTGSVGALV